MAGMAPEVPETEGRNEGVREDVRDMVEVEAGSLFSRHARVFVYINTATLVAIVFGAGVWYQRFIALETKVAAMQDLSAMAMQITYLSQQVTRLQDQIDRLLAREGMRR